MDGGRLTDMDTETDADTLKTNPFIYLDQVVVGLLQTLLDNRVISKDDLKKIHERAQKEATTKTNE